jgi:hypothetical protein
MLLKDVLVILLKLINSFKPFTISLFSTNRGRGARQPPAVGTGRLEVQVSGRKSGRS